MENDIYVVVAENDQFFKRPNSGELYKDDGGPIIFEQYVRSADLENIKERAKIFSKNHGRCRIAKLVFIEADDG